MAGRAFQTGLAVSALSAPPPGYWIPIFTSDERLGVLEVTLDPVDQMDDPHLREQCQWLAALLGHLLAGVDDHGDSIDALRQTRLRTAGAQLIWGTASTAHRAASTGSW